MRRAATVMMAVGLAALAWLGLPHGSDASPAPEAPEFTHTAPEAWINSAPLTLAGLRGQVVLIDVWTFECWNCYRSFPWLKSVEERFGPRGLTVIGVHSPEFAHERERSSIERKVAEFGLPHPVMIDNDFSYWKALGNRYWPSYYLVDKRGRIRARFVGETHADTDRARKVEGAIETLLAE